VRRYIGLGLAVFLAGCGSAQVTATAVRETTAVAASCAGLSPAEQFAAARLVFVGVMAPGPTTRLGGPPVLGSPARMQVERYLKGEGPQTVRVDTAVTIESDAIGIAEDGIAPRAGERWKIYTYSRRQPFATSFCAGSRRVAAGPLPAGPPASPTGRATLAVWRAFPVSAKPRPIVPLGEGNVLDPRSGFPTAAAQFAFMEGRFAVRAPLPGTVGSFGRFEVVSATDAYDRLRAASRQYGFKAAPLIITSVDIATPSFLTDRGRMRLPAWQFHFKQVADPASVLALAAPDMFTAPGLHRFGPPGPGNSIEDAATISASGKAITISFIGAHAGGGACDSAYRATAVSDSRAVAFTITAIPTLAQAAPGQICTAVGYKRLAVLHLARPLGARVLISATDGGAVPVTPTG
jgi:hypothetical protein